MKQPNQSNPHQPIRQQLPHRNVQMRTKQSNYSVSSQVSFNGQNKKPKSKSFNRKQGNSQSSQMPPIVKIYRQLQYPVEIRNLLKKFCYLDKEKLIKLSLNDLRQLCEKELKRIDIMRRNNSDVQRVLSEEEVEETDNQLSLVVMSWQIGVIVEFRNQLKLNESGGNQNMTRTRLRQYENLLLEVEKSDQVIKNFINTHIKLPNPSDISIPTLKKFFKKQASKMSQSSDRIILSRKTLCQIIIFLCRLLEGQILAFDDIYEYKDESSHSIEFGDEYNKYVVKSRTVRNNQVIVQNLDQSFEESEGSSNRHSHNHSQKQYQNGSYNYNQNNKNGDKYQSYSNDDLGKKVNQLSQICEQIPQLQSFKRTLKFSKITLENRQNFFKIVDVIIALHHKIGYLSRNKPTLLREIQSIENDLTEVYQTIREYVVKLTSDVPQFGELRFYPNQDSKHQLTEMIAYLRKELKKLGNVVLDQHRTQNELYDKIEFYRAMIQMFCQSINDGDEALWQEHASKAMTSTIGDQQKSTVNLLSECYNTIFTELRQTQRPQQDLQTEKNLEAQVHTLLTDYQRLRGQHQQLQNKYNILLEQKDELIFDVEERDKIISNLSAIKVSSQKREKSLRDQLLQAQEDASRFEHDLQLLQEQLEIMSIDNQNKVNEMIYEHQTEVKELVDKITMLERAKMELLGKYQDECGKSIRLLQDGNCSSVEMQTLKDRLDKKTKEHDQINRKQKQLINGLQKQLQQLKNEKSLLQNKLQLAQKNKNKLMDRLQEVTSKYSQNVRGFQDKYQQQLNSLKQAHYKMEKQLEKYKRNNGLLSDQIQQLKAQHAAQLKIINEYRMKLLQLSTLQNEYESLTKEYDRVVENYHKLQAANQTYRQRVIELTAKQEELLELLAKEKDINRKLDKKCKDQDLKLQEIINSYEGNDMDLKQQQKINKILQKKISQLETELQQLQNSIQNKDKTYSLNINKIQLKYQQLHGELQDEIDKLKKDNKDLKGENDKIAKDLKMLERQFKEQIAQGQQKQAEWNKIKGQIEKKLNEKEDQNLSLYGKNRLLDEQSYNQTILIQQIKQEKHILELKINQLQNGDKQELAQLKNNLQAMQKGQKALKDKITQLQEQLQRLESQVQILNKMIEEKQKQLQVSHQQARQREKQRQDEQNQRRFQQYQSQKTEEITKIRQQILIQKNVIITENNKLHEENNNLQEQIAKLKQLNDLLQKNIHKLQTTSSQAKDTFINQENQFKQTISKHLFTITSLQNQLTGVNAERQMLRRDYEEVLQKLQLKIKQLTEKDNLLFEKELEKNNLDKVVKELKFKITELEGVIDGMNSAMEKLKSGRIKALEQEINQLTLLLQDWKKKQQLARLSLNDFQLQLDKSKRDLTKKLQSSKQQKLQLQQHYQNHIKKLQSQHQLQLSSLQQKTRKDAENQFNQALIKQKEMFNLLTIQKMEELGEMQRKYEKLIRDERNGRNLLQEEYDRLEREFVEWKRNKAINESKILQEESDNNSVQQQLQKLRTQYDALKRQHTRLQQQNNRLNQQTATQRQQNSTLISKLLQAQHTITILTSKLNLLTQNLQTTKKSLQDMHKVELEKMDLEREVQKLKNKTINDEVRINDYKMRLSQAEERMADLEGKLQGWRSKELEWTRDNNDSTQRFRLLNSQNNQMSLKLQQMKHKLNQITTKLTQKTQRLQTVQSHLHLSQQKIQQKEIELSTLKQHLQLEINILQQQLNKKSTAIMMLERDKKELISEWEVRVDELKQDGEIKMRRVRELEIQLNQYRKNLNEGKRMIEELSQVNSQKKGLEDRLSRLESEFAKVKGDKLALQRENQLLRRQLNSLGSEKSKSTTYLIDLQHQNTLLSTQNSQLSHKIQQLLQELRKQKQLSLKQLKKLQDRLRAQQDSQKQAIINEFQHIIKGTSEQLKRQQAKNNQFTIKYNRLLQEMQENTKMLQKLRRQNMQLSDHCQKYEERIHVLENQYKVKGQFSVEIQTKYQSTQFEITRLNDANRFLQAELEKMKNQNLLQKQRIQVLERDFENCLADLNHSEKRSDQLQAEKDRILNDLKNLQLELNNLQLKFNQTMADLQKAKQLNASLQQTLSQSSKQIEQLQITISSYQTNVTSSNSQLERFRAQAIRLQQLLTQANKQIDILKRNLVDSNQKTTETQRERQMIRGENHSLLEKIKQREREIQLLANQVGVLQQNLHQANGYIQWSDNERKAMDEKIRELLAVIEKLEQEIKNLKGKLFHFEGENNNKDYNAKHLSTENQSLIRKVSELQNYLKQLQNQQKLTLQQKSTQQSAEIQRLKAQLALTRQQVVRLNEVIKRKEEDFQKEITRLTEQKDAIWKDNQLMAQEIQSFKIRLSEGERLLEVKNKEVEGERKEKERLMSEIESLRRQLADVKRQLTQSNQMLSDLQRKQQQLLRSLAQSQRKQQQLTRTLIAQQGEVRRLSNQNQTHKSRLSAYSQQQDQQVRLSESRMREQTEFMGSEIARLQSELAVTRMEYSRLNGEHGKLNAEHAKLNGEYGKLNEQHHKLNGEYSKLNGDHQKLNQEYLKLNGEYSRLSGEHQKLVGDFNRVNGEIGHLAQQNTRLREEFHRLNQEIHRLNQQTHKLNEQIRRLNEQTQKHKSQAQYFKKQLSSRDQSLLHLTNQLQTLSQQSSNKHAISSSIKQDLDKANLQLSNLRATIFRLEQQNKSLNSHLLSKDKIIVEMKDNVNKGNELMENADRELKRVFEEKNRQGEVIKGLVTQRDGYLQVIRSRESEILSLKETITIMQRRITELTTEIHHLTQTNEQTLNQSRSSINLVTKSYSYQGGQVTAAELTRLEEQNRRLIKEIESRDINIQRHINQIQRLNKQIKVLKEQIRLLSQGKTINLKGYTRVTNNNDTSLNTKGIVYTEYDVKEMRAKIQLLEKSLARYQDRETQLLREVEKYKFRQRHLLGQIKGLQQTQKTKNKLNKPDSIKQIPQNSPQKKTAFDQQYNNRQNQPKSSTYRIQTGIEVTQHTINMTKKQIKTTEKHISRMESIQLRRILQRLSSGQQIMSSKIDQILHSSQKSNKQNLELVLVNNQFNLTPVIINQIRQLIHQNKALVETLRAMGQFREDVGVLIQEYVDPELLTEFVYKILTYFSQVDDQSKEAREIRNQLDMIRKNNVGGFYFTVLEEYTKYILEQNSIEAYKEELRQKARELISLRDKFQAIFDSKLEEKDNLLNRSDSKNSFMNRSRTKYMGSSGMGSSRGKSECSELSKDGSNSRVIEVKDNGSGTESVNLPQGNYTLPNPIHLLTNAGHGNYIPSTMLSPMLVTADRPRTTSTITYTPYNNNKQVVQTTTPTVSVNDSRTRVVYSSTSMNQTTNSYTTVNSTNGNFGKSGFDKK